ncbi:DUF2163 domain-containing protein [Paenirhodobacter sp. CAU 1674]|uniref:DUF2163 domain-containing protein n=1 Tax=Paenirhodobacter sp. CAU 1674 TaxID=3032596 RepID=UPI0023DCC5B1|nr:DUF2163 domain-containing protein [Paenirhodobacter sp. CAU 1674]MDF2140305.1 DUF2163 domain-containing protein [Paenirhodobacter sp. CAU 1674]
MKTLPAGFQAHLDEGTTTLAWCWRLQRRDGAVFGFTDHDRVLTFAGTSFEPETGFAASEIRSLGDLSVDAQDVQGALRSDRITETDIADGLWDNAAVEVWLVNWQAVSQRLLMRRGSIGEIRRGRHAFTAEVRALAHLLNQPVGRTFQYFCDATLGDARCGVNIVSPAYRGTGSVTATIGDRRFTVATGLGAFASGWFDFGVVEWTSGANAGRRAEVASHTLASGTATITLMEAPVRPIALGDAFAITAGCDKRHATCRDRFGNAINFRGFPSIPGDDLVTRYPNETDANSGAPLRPLADG